MPGELGPEGPAVTARRVKLAPEVELGVTKAIELLKKSASRAGFIASASFAHYNLWARDACFSSIGANVSGDRELVAAARRSLLTLARFQSQLGQIPDAAWPQDGYWDFGEAGATDAPALFICAAAWHLKQHPDTMLRLKLWPALEKAFTWLRYQDANQFGLIDSPEAADWMDSSFVRSGKVMYVNALYVRAAQAMADLAPLPWARARYQKQANLLKEKFNNFFWPNADFNYVRMLDGLAYPKRPEEFPHPASNAAYKAAIKPDRGYYISHVQWGRFVDECDVLGNVLAVLFDIAPSERATTIMTYMHTNGAVTPTPCRTYLRNQTPDDTESMYKPDADKFQGERWRNPTDKYHRGDWPFIGGLYVAALEKVGMHAEAMETLKNLTAANRARKGGGEWGFPEWNDGQTGAPDGAQDQSWSGSGQIVAARAVQGTKLVF